MKIKNLVISLMFLCVFTACNKQEDTVMVKAINFSIEENEYKIEIIAYDFTNAQEAYTTYTFVDTNYSKAFVSAFNKYNLDVSICDYIFLDSSIIEEKNINLVLNVVEEFSINVDANIIQSDTISAENYLDIKKQNTQISPIYSIKKGKNTVNFILPVLNEDLYVSSALIINSDGNASYLSKEELNIALMLLAGNQNYNYNFENSKYTASINNSFANFNMEDEVLQISVYLDIDKRGGAVESDVSKAAFDTKLIYDVQGKVYDLYNDQVIRNALNLDWVEKQYNQEIEDIKIIVKILTN